MKYRLTRSEYEELSPDEKKDYLSKLNPEEMAELFELPQTSQNQPVSEPIPQLSDHKQTPEGKKKVLYGRAFPRFGIIISTLLFVITAFYLHFYFPSRTITGEIFIVTQGGQSIKLGLVKVMVFKKSDLDSYIAAKKVEAAGAISKLKPEAEKANDDLQRAKLVWDKTKSDFENELNNHEDIDASGNFDEAKWKKMANIPDTAQNDYYAKVAQLSDVTAKLLQYSSAQFLFDSLPQPLQIAKSDADGKFQIAVGRNGPDFVIAAAASRMVAGNDTEKYYWLVPLAADTLTITLSNDNLTSVPGGSLILTNDP